MTITRWQPRPRIAGTGTLHAARFSPHLPGQAYRDMHAELLHVARLAFDGAETSEALFAEHGLVLVARWYFTGRDGRARWEYTVIEPGDYLCFSEAYGSLAAATAKSLENGYDPAEPAPVT